MSKRVEAAQAASPKSCELISDEFQFDLIVRKTEGLLGDWRGSPAQGGARTGTVRDAVAVRARYARDRERRRPPRQRRAAATPATKAEIGLVALALLHPELRNEIAQSGAEANFEEIRLGGVLADLCKTDEPYTALEEWIADRLTPDEQGRVSEFAVGPLNDEVEDETAKVSTDLDKCRALANDFVVALERRRRMREVGRLRASGADVSTRRQ